MGWPLPLDPHLFSHISVPAELRSASQWVAELFRGPRTPGASQSLQGCSGAGTSATAPLTGSLKETLSIKVWGHFLVWVLTPHP